MVNQHGDTTVIPEIGGCSARSIALSKIFCQIRRIPPGAFACLTGGLAAGSLWLVRHSSNIFRTPSPGCASLSAIFASGRKPSHRQQTNPKIRFITAQSPFSGSTAA